MSRSPKPPHAGGAPVVWEGDAAPLAKLGEWVAAVAPPGSEGRVVMWVEATRREVLGARLVEASALPAALLELLDGALRRARRASLRPAVLRLRDARLAAAVRAHLRVEGVAVEVAPALPAWDALAAQVGGLVAEDEAPPATALAGEGVTPALMESLFRAAADYYTAAPWRQIDDTPLELHLPGHPAPLLATVLGGGGVERGLALYFSAQELRELLRGGEPSLAFPDALGLTYEAERTVPPGLRAERKRHRWPLAGPSAFPVLMRTRPPDAFCDPAAAELRLLAAALQAVRELVQRHGPRLRAHLPVREAVPVRTADGGDATARVVFPAELAEPDGGGGPGEGPRLIRLDDTLNRHS